MGLREITRYLFTFLQIGVVALVLLGSCFGNGIFFDLNSKMDEKCLRLVSYFNNEIQAVFLEKFTFHNFIWQ